MRRVEVESFVKSFILFFTSLGLLIITLFYINYTQEVKTLEERIFAEMRVCSYDLKCEQFSIDFVPLKNQENYKLLKTDGLSAFFPIPGSQEFVMEIKLDAQALQKQIAILQRSALWRLSGTMLVVLLLSVIFSLYALYPLRNALSLTQEFIKDILHDFNTPLGALRLNSAMLKREIGDNTKVDRIEQSVQNVLDLQENLRAYLYNHEAQKERFALKSLVDERVALLSKSYADISFKVDVDAVTLLSNRAALQRVLDNLLTNACKYNKPRGSVMLQYDADKKLLKIIDTGKGIKNSKRIFERFYKEQERGIGIGLHIVKKLCDELGVKILVESEVGVGSTFTLELHKLVYD